MKKKSAKPKPKSKSKPKLKPIKKEAISLPGTALKNEDFTENRVFLTTWTPQAEYQWDAGIAIGRYLNELKRGVLMGRMCKHCGRVVIPPRMFCELCFNPTSKWVPLADTGTVNTFSLCYISWNMERLKEPQIPAVIEIDGASKQVGIMHLLGEVLPKKVNIGMRVKAVWKEPHERQGAITDIKYFRPI